MRRLLPLASLALALGFFSSTAPALAGTASAGEPLFYPCTTCHPVLEDQPERKLPNDFKGHQIVLVGHDALGSGGAACLVCHDEPSRNPAMLKLVDGSLVDITGDVSRVCYRCHSSIYNEWKAGGHGRHQPKCTAAGCHDPHTPGSIYAQPLLPFVGNGFQVEVLPEMQAFMPLATPGTTPPAEVPSWLVGLTTFGVVLAGGIAGSLIRGRSKR